MRLSIEHWVAALAGDTSESIGYAAIEFPDLGFILTSVRVLRDRDGKVVARPIERLKIGREGRVVIENGRPVYTKMIIFMDALCEREFSEAVVGALRRAHPEALAMQPTAWAESAPEAEPSR